MSFSFGCIFSELNLDIDEVAFLLGGSTLNAD